MPISLVLSVLDGLSDRLVFRGLGRQRVYRRLQGSCFWMFGAEFSETKKSEGGNMMTDNELLPFAIDEHTGHHLDEMAQMNPPEDELGEDIDRLVYKRLQSTVGHIFRTPMRAAHTSVQFFFA